MSEYMTEWNRELQEALGAAFPDDEVEFLPKGSYNGKARALAYIDARAVMRRLDATVGPGNWHFFFDALSPDGKMVKGYLTVLGVTKCDAGEGGTEDEPLKSAVSDAIKRCAVHFGIGRYLHYLPQVWVPYDAQKRRFTEEPRIAPEAVAKALAICGIAAPARAAGSYLSVRPESRGDAAASTAPPGGRGSIWADRAASSYEAPADAEAPAAPPQRMRPPAGHPRTHAAMQNNEQQSVGELAGAPTGHVCSEPGCGREIPEKVFKFSTERHGKPLCFNHQPKGNRG